jgi:hypothetical protein
LGDGAGASFDWHVQELACSGLTLAEPRFNDGKIGPRSARAVTGRQQLQDARIGCLQQDGAVFVERSLADADGAVLASNEIPAIAIRATQPSRE